MGKTWLPLLFRSLLKLCAALSIVLAPAGARAQGATFEKAEKGADAVAQSLFEQGSTALKRGRFRAALGLFEEAYGQAPNPRLLYNIGVAAESDGQAGRALAAYAAYLQSAQNVDKRDDVESSVSRLQATRTANAKLRPPVGYQQLMEQARGARNAGQYEESWQLYRRADSLYPTARTLLGLGTSELKLHRYAISVLHFDAALSTNTEPLDGNLTTEAKRLRLLARQESPNPTSPQAAAANAAVDEDVANALALYQRACDGGSLEACTNLGVNYCFGRGVPKDYARARNLFTQACDGGELRACANLGLLHQNGWGVPKDYGRAYLLYKKACDGKNMLGCMNLADVYESGLGVAQDYARAVTLFSQICDAGNLVGCTEVGRMFELGRGVATDFNRSVQLYARACNGQEMYGCAKLGYAYAVGHGVKQDQARAVELSTKACEGNQMLGCTNLGLYREFGQGIEKSLSIALDVYTRACGNGFVPACTNAGNLQMQLADAARKNRLQ